MNLNAGSGKNLDNMLYGGIETACITEIYRGFQCGKTEMAHTLAVLLVGAWY